MLIKLKLIHSSQNELKYERVLDEDSQLNNMGLKPSGELLLHLLLQYNWKDSNRIVLHLHPTYIISAMYAGIDLQSLSTEFPELSRYTTVGPTVPVLPPITRELAFEVVKNFNLNEQGEVAYDIIPAMNHGVFVVAKDVWTAFEHIERLEHICKIVLAARK